MLNMDKTTALSDDLMSDDLNIRLVHETGAALAIAQLAEPVLDDLGFRLVRVRFLGKGNSQVQIMAERQDGTLTIDDCVAISRALSPVMDVEDPISSKYNLEISSPGIDRPLVRPNDFERWAGYDAKVELNEPIAERRRFKGRLEGFLDGEVRIYVKSQDGSQEEILIGLPFNKISDAKLIMTDELFEKSRKQNQEKAENDNTGDGDNDTSGFGDGSEIDTEQLN